MGRKVAGLADGRKDERTNRVRFDTMCLVDGVYFYRLEAGSHTQTRKLLDLK